MDMFDIAQSLINDIVTSLADEVSPAMTGATKRLNLRSLHANS